LVEISDSFAISACPHLQKCREIIVNAVWLPLSIVAGFLQIIRNAAQRGLSDQAGPWGAALVRFLFGLPFALIFLGLTWRFAPPVAPHLDAKVAFILSIGAAAQVCATAALMASMRASSFALGSTFQHMSLPLAALFGALFLGDVLSVWGWIGIGLATFGLVFTSWPDGGIKVGLSAGPGAFKAGLYGLMSGACFAVSANAYRACGMAIDPLAPFFSVFGHIGDGADTSKRCSGQHSFRHRSSRAGSIIW
jgi:drug/metabolite transporter (DMT)-like permease